MRQWGGCGYDPDRTFPGVPRLSPRLDRGRARALAMSGDWHRRPHRAAAPRDRQREPRPRRSGARGARPLGLRRPGPAGARLGRRRRKRCGPIRPSGALPQDVCLARFLAAADLREASAASPEGAPGLRQSRMDREAALEELRPLVLEAPDDPDVLRSLSVYYGLDGRPDEVARLAARSGETSATDPWWAFAAMAAAVRGRAPAEAEPLLSAFLAAAPGDPPSPHVAGPGAPGPWRSGGGGRCARRAPRPRPGPPGGQGAQGPSARATAGGAALARGAPERTSALRAGLPAAQEGEGTTRSG